MKPSEDGGSQLVDEINPILDEMKPIEWMRCSLVVRSSTVLSVQTLQFFKSPGF